MSLKDELIAEEENIRATRREIFAAIIDDLSRRERKHLNDAVGDPENFSSAAIASTLIKRGYLQINEQLVQEYRDKNNIGS